MLDVVLPEPGDEVARTAVDDALVAAEARAEAAEVRADAAEVRADAAEVRAEAAEARADELDSRISELSDEVERLQIEPADDTAPQPLAAVVLRVTDLKDGDSWVASDGQEYRLGLVNAPERSETCGAEAADFTASFLAGGFTADAYTTDTFGRLVAEVFGTDGVSLNVALAASGLGDDRYLEEFAHEHPDLADRVREALAGAEQQPCRASAQAPVGLLDQPSETPTSAAPAPTATNEGSASPSCHSAYITCIPVKGDGSGNGDANDLDCGDIRRRVQVRTPGQDPYRLDRDGDGWGCESYG